MIQSTGVFLDTANFAARFTLTYRKRLDNGLLFLRDVPEDEDVARDLPILDEWRSAKALLMRLRAEAAVLLRVQKVYLGKAWLEQLPGNCGTPWLLEEDDYAQAHIRTRTCIIPAMDCFSFCGAQGIILAPGVVNQIEHRKLCAEINMSAHPRVHLIVDVRRPEPEGDDGLQ